MVNTSPTIINQINNKYIDKPNNNKFSYVGLEEEKEISYLDKECILKGAKYYKYNRIIVKSKI